MGFGFGDSCHKGINFETILIILLLLWLLPQIFDPCHRVFGASDD